MCENELPSSELGTFKHWDNAYKTELVLFRDIGDPGTEWFGRSSTKRMTNWIERCSSLKKNSPLLDIGCGNGLLLVELAKSGFTHLVGVDYCESALELAREVFADEGYDSNDAKWLKLDITRETLINPIVEQNGAGDPFAPLDSYSVWDKTKPTPSTREQSKFAVCLDKGTYDAISLCPDNPREQRSKYIREISALMDDDGWFLITSCNWTSSELKTHFSNLSFVEELPAPTITFGGKSGKSTYTCLFKKKVSPPEQNAESS